MTIPRKNVRFYLRPERAANEAAAIQILDSTPDGWQADIARDACLAGLALRMIDNNLFTYLASTLATQHDPEALRKSLLLLLNKGAEVTVNNVTVHNAPGHPPLNREPEEKYASAPVEKKKIIDPPELKPTVAPSQADETRQNLVAKFYD